MFRDFNGILIDEIFLPYSGSFYLTQISEFLIHKVKDKYCPEGGGDPAGETGADSDRVMGERRRGVFSIFTTLEGSKIQFLLLFWGSKSVISKRSVISNPRPAPGFLENLSCKTQMNVCAP